MSESFAGGEFFNQQVSKKVTYWLVRHINHRTQRRAEGKIDGGVRCSCTEIQWSKPYDQWREDEKIGCSLIPTVLRSFYRVSFSIERKSLLLCYIYLIMKRVTKEDIKREVDSLPETVLNRLYKFIGTLKQRKTNKHSLPTHDFKGKFDEIDIRSRAYE